MSSRAAHINALDHALDVSIQNVAVCEIQNGARLVVAPVEAFTSYLVLAGTMHVSFADHPDLVAETGMLVLVPAGLRPSISGSAEPAVDVLATRGATRLGSLVVLDAAGGQAGDLRLLVGRLVSNSVELPIVLGDIAAPLLSDLRDDHVASAATTAILKEIGRAQVGSAVLVTTLLKACVVISMRQMAAHLAKSGVSFLSPLNPQLATVTAAILARPRQSHCIDSLAKLAGMSRSTFARQFAEAMGSSPMEFVQRVRLRHAAALLDSTAMSIKEIAASSGFASRSHFSRAFRCLHGLDPTRFRSRPNPVVARHQ
ncbi:helix-turn-helix domain-containing protein [Sphingoaurantiacus capsulatus]|uniref:Helix-turn-helix domain-containing protein n=1 Tax=Sphingoaurantiacus capsulatus TaxID=1771310 RepID=A0ABV7X8W1_9SPHN